MPSCYVEARYPYNFSVFKRLFIIIIMLTVVIGGYVIWQTVKDLNYKVNETFLRLCVFAVVATIVLKVYQGVGKKVLLNFEDSVVRISQLRSGKWEMTKIIPKDEIKTIGIESINLGPQYNNMKVGRLLITTQANDFFSFAIPNYLTESVKKNVEYAGYHIASERNVLK